MSVKAPLQSHATWTHNEWYKHAECLNNNLDDLEKRIKSHHIIPINVSTLGAAWRIIVTSISDLDNAIFSETADPKDKKNLLQRLDKKALDVASLAQSVLNQTVLRPKL